MTFGFIQKLKTGCIKTEDEDKFIAIWRQGFFLKKVGLFRLLADGNALHFSANSSSRRSEQMHEGVEVMMHF